jgi:hypothetical protein
MVLVMEQLSFIGGKCGERTPDFETECNRFNPGYLDRYFQIQWLSQFWHQRHISQKQLRPIESAHVCRKFRENTSFIKLMFTPMQFYGPQQYRMPQICNRNQAVGRSRINGKYVKVKFAPEEDARLLELIQEYGTNNWLTISSIMQTRNPRQCRERFKNYLDPELNREPWTTEEDNLLEEKYREFGAKWNKIGQFFQNRSDNSLRNRWMMIDRRAKGEVMAPISPVPIAPAEMESKVRAKKRLPDVVPIFAKSEAKDHQDQQELAMNLFEIFDAFNPDAWMLEEDPFKLWGGFYF